jgi:hypothetical protein
MMGFFALDDGLDDAVAGKDSDWGAKKGQGTFDLFARFLCSSLSRMSKYIPL